MELHLIDITYNAVLDKDKEGVAVNSEAEC
jgi:hypothetical protein